MPPWVTSTVPPASVTMPSACAMLPSVAETSSVPVAPMVISTADRTPADCTATLPVPSPPITI